MFSNGLLMIIVLSVCVYLFICVFQVELAIMASVKKSVLMEYLQCTLCMEDIQRSCILQCHHTFCINCLQKYMAQATDPQKIPCPICRKVTSIPHGDLTSLPPNFFMDNLKELITKETDDDVDEIEVPASAHREIAICSLEDCQGEAVIYCTVCQENLCQTCSDEHGAGRFTRKHKTIATAETKGKVTSSTKSHHPCGRHPNQMLDMYCKTCEEIICYACINTEHSDHNFTTLHPFIKPCVERLDTILKKIDKLLKSVDLARQTSQQQVDKAQNHIVNLKTQVTTTFRKIRAKLAQQEERLISDLKRAATRTDKVASSTKKEQQLVDVNLQSLHFLSQSLRTDGDVYNQLSNLPSLEEAVEKRWSTEIPGVIWLGISDEDEKNINLSDADHLTLRETAHTTYVRPRFEWEDGSDRVPYLEGDIVPSIEETAGASSNKVPRLEVGICNVVDAAYTKPEQTSDSAEITRFGVEHNVTGICLYNNIIFLVKCDAALYMYRSSGELMKRHIVTDMCRLYDVTVMTQDDSDKVIITSYSPHALNYIPVKSAGDTCILGTRERKVLNYVPWGLCVNHKNNLIVTDQTNGSLHVYNSAGDEINTIKLPSSKPLYLSSDSSGGYIVTDSHQIMWIDEQGAQQRRHKDTAFGIALSELSGVVRDSENRYLVADNNQLLLFSKDGGDVRCLAKDKIARPHSLYLDHQQGLLYVGINGVVVFDYYMLLGQKRPIKYHITKLGLKPTNTRSLSGCDPV